MKPPDAGVRRGADRAGVGRPLPTRPPPPAASRGTPLFLEGTRSDTVVLVISGRVKVFSSAADGTEVVLAVRGPGPCSASWQRSTSSRSQRRYSPWNLSRS